MPPTPSVTISSPAGSLLILPVSARTAQMRRFQVFTRQGGAGAAAQAKAEFLLELFPEDVAAQREARQLYAGRLGGMEGFPPEVVEARLRTDLWDGVFIAGYYVPAPGAVPMMPAAATNTADLLADPPGTPERWSVPQRIAAMLRRIPKNMPEALRAQVAALLSPDSIAALAIFFAVLAAAQLVGAGEVADAILAALAWRLAGLAGFYALGRFIGEIIVAARATTLPEIETAAKNAAGDLVTLGVQFLSAVVLRAVAQRKMGSAKAEPEPEPEPQPPPNNKPPPKSRPGGAGGSTGPGSWQTVNESMSPRAAAYQSQITGQPVTQSYVVNGVKFDGYNSVTGLQEAKGPGYSNFVKNGQFQPWFNGSDGLLNQANSQLAAANGTPITWSVAEPDATTAIQNLFQRNNIQGINVINVPPKP